MESYIKFFVMAILTVSISTTVLNDMYDNH